MSNNKDSLIIFIKKIKQGLRFGSTVCETYMKGSANRASLRAQKALLLQNELGFKSKFYRK